MNNRVCGESVNTARDGRHLLDAWSTDATPSDVQSRERRRRYPSDMSAAGPLLDHSTSREGGGSAHQRAPTPISAHPAYPGHILARSNAKKG